MLRRFLLLPLACSFALQVATAQACEKHLPQATGVLPNAAGLSSR